MLNIYINYGTNAEQMTYDLMEEARVGEQLRSSMRVVLKPNLVVSRPADQGATTHPEIIRGVVRYLLECGVGDITIAEGSWVGDSTQSAFQACGYNAIAREYGVKLLDTKRDTVRKVTEQGMQLSLCASILDADYLINLPVLKGHCQTNMTCCLKNLKGCIPDSEKRRFHATGLHKPIAILANALRPHLHIVDSICGDLTFEEGGNPVQSDRILLGFDPVLLDSYGAELMGYEPDEVEHLRLAKAFGVGCYCDDDTKIIELNIQNRPKAVPHSGRRTKQLARYIDERSACSACYAGLVYALDKMGTYGLKDGECKIGQGFQNQVCAGIGIGNCAVCCTENVPGCPPKAADIVRFLKSR